MKHVLLAAVFALAFATPALAYHCPVDMAKIDAALAANPQISSEQMAQVKAHRAKGEALHKSGKHGQSVETLAEAMKILGIK